MRRKVAWILGGAKGLGVMIAKGLAEEGYRLAINYRRSQTAANELQRELAQMGCESLILQGDVSQLADVKRMVSEIITSWGRIDVLVCTAGPFVFRSTPTIGLTDEQWRNMIDGNLSSVFYCVREVIPLMRKQGGGRIITFGFSGVDSAPAWEGYAAYAAAKVGLVSLTRSLAREEAPYGITVNMIAPGDIRDPFKEAPIAAARGKEDPRSLVGRPGTGEDIARVVRFLAHPDSDFITGAIIPVTGGFDLRRDFVK
ncbi:SDR family oxidoreductase [Thermoflavimicrobium dichotomicum]|uniref:3-oxoacyl-[acyl-carrier protein] reductase n=1 Tax=Thermoflavimicrobium dichotomicum TaxID=46223 RepID=A0A1I3RJX7_9BACL|nr:SDR family oxidoreductase [Thermoflavimicrobium dichotomicum]SFJ46142.1 3-oxoacyl-[acyl-carrier protein] reductase [Thermoflavimicrobium dichotomicum]